MDERVFRVGQRVRIVKSLNCPRHIGRVATITKINRMDQYSHDYWFERGMSVSPVGTPMCELDIKSFLQPDRQAWFAQMHLEPYDDGRDATEWTTELRKLCGLGVKERV